MFQFDLYYNPVNSEIGPLGYAYQLNFVKIEPTPCDQLKSVDLSKINYNAAQLENAVCYEFIESQKIGVFEEGEIIFNPNIVGMMRPCAVTAENNCEVTDKDG